MEYELDNLSKKEKIKIVKEWKMFTKHGDYDRCYTIKNIINKMDKNKDNWYNHMELLVFKIYEEFAYKYIELFNILND